MKKFKWVVEFSVDESWVEDGFEIDQDRALDMMANALPYAYGYEFNAEVLKAPDQKLIRKVQGYPN